MEHVFNVLEQLLKQWELGNAAPGKFSIIPLKERLHVVDLACGKVIQNNNMVSLLRQLIS